MKLHVYSYRIWIDLSVYFTIRQSSTSWYHEWYLTIYLKSLIAYVIGEHHKHHSCVTTRLCTSQWYTPIVYDNNIQYTYMVIRVNAVLKVDVLMKHINVSASYAARFWPVIYKLDMTYAAISISVDLQVNLRIWNVWQLQEVDNRVSSQLV